MARRSKAGEDQLELTGLGEESPPGSGSDVPESADPAGTGDSDVVPPATGAERRSPFAMGRMSSRTREVHLARGDDPGPIPGPWKLRAVVRPGPGSNPTSSSGSRAVSRPETLAEDGIPDESQD